MTVERVHGTRARYVFGAWGQDRSLGCRCPACTAANNAYARFSAKRVRLNRRSGSWARPYVDTRRAAAHIDTLRTQGCGARQVAHLAGLHRSQVTNITAGRVTQIRTATEQAILNVTFDPADHAVIDAARTWHLIDELLTAGVTKKQVGQAVTGNPNAQALQLGKHHILARAARRVADLHRETFPPAPFACTCGVTFRTRQEWADHNDGLDPAQYSGHRLQVAS